MTPPESEAVTKATLRIPAPLRSLAGGASELPIRSSAHTVRDVLDDIATRHPDLVARVRTDDGTLRHFVNLFVGSKNVEKLDGLDTEVHEGAVVSIVPAVAGGSGS